jgi:hypothetical protein
MYLAVFVSGSTHRCFLLICVACGEQQTRSELSQHTPLIRGFACSLFEGRGIKINSQCLALRRKITVLCAYLVGVSKLMAGADLEASTTEALGLQNSKS